jgi:hypothetical protein
MANKMYASEDGLRLGVFEGESNHLLLFDYIPSLDVVEVKIMRGEEVEARFHISAHDNQYGRKYEGLLGIEHYFTRIREALEANDKLKFS